MTTPTGTITMLDVILELDGVATPREITLNDADVRGLADVPSGEISMDDLRGKSNVQIVVQGFMTVGHILVGFVDNYYGANTTNHGSFRDVTYGNVPIGTATLAAIDSVETVLAEDWYDNVLFVNADVDFSATANYLTVRGHGADRVVELPTKLPNIPAGQVTVRSVTGSPPNIFSAADLGLEFEFFVTSEPL